MSKNDRKKWGLESFTCFSHLQLLACYGKILTISSCVVLKLVVVTLLNASILLSPELGSAGSQIIEGRVVKVLDGDSLLVDDGKKVLEVRLWGIDSPEYKQPYGNMARRLANKLAKNKQAKIYSHGTDQYSRILGEVYIDNLCLNEEMVIQGAAWVYRRYCKKNVCKDWLNEEKKARKAKSGLWHNDNPVAPWKWRRKE